MRNDHVMSPTHSGSVMVGGIKISNVFLCQECPVNILSESRLMLAGVGISKKSHGHSTVLSSNGSIIKYDCHSQEWTLRGLQGAQRC